MGAGSHPVHPVPLARNEFGAMMEPKKPVPVPPLCGFKVTDPVIGTTKHCGVWVCMLVPHTGNHWLVPVWRLGL